ncbi:MAG: MinD/ParA family protein [Gallionella sp.]|nr:MAG: MinD/ParA family protein [Gallionella sp.]
MRPDSGVDQAEGLRRLLVRARHGEAEPFCAGVPASHLLTQSAGYASNVSEVRNQTQVIAIVAGKPGVGRTSATINLAAALASSGKDVLVLDENPAPNNLQGRLGLFARYDLLDVAQGKCTPREAVLAAKGFSVLPAARAMCALVQMKRIERQRLENALAGISSEVDVMLVDAAMPVLGRAERLAAVSPGLASGAALLVVVDVTASGITESYALIKRLALENARLHFKILVNKAVGGQAAMTVFDNMEKVARRNLAARLEYLGYIPRDDRLKRATQLGRPVVEAFPAAVSARAYLELPQKLLRPPARQDEAGGGARAITQSLMGQTPQPLRQHSREMPHVVN